MRIALDVRRKICCDNGTPARRCSVLLILCLWAGVALAQGALAPFVIGRVDFESPISDITEHVLRDAFGRIGVPIEFERYPLRRSIEMANDGLIDADLHRIVDAGAMFGNLIRVPTAVNRLDVAMYVASPRLASTTRAELKTLRIGIPRGGLAGIKHTRGLTTIETGPPAESFEMLLAERIDMVIWTYIDAEVELRAHPNPNVLRWQFLWASEPLYLYVNHKHGDLAARVDSALQQMQREGSIEKYHVDALRLLKLAPLLPEDGRAMPTR